MALGHTDEMVTELVLRARDEATETINRLGEHMSHVGELAGGFALGALGLSAISEAVGGIEELGRGLIESNATAEQLQQTFAAIYQSGPKAQEAMSWLTQFAMNAPFTRESIQQAGVQIASIGQDITTVLPALGNLAAVMGTDMPTAAQALTDAFEGRFAMMQRDLHVTKQQLEEYGLQVDNTGHVTQSTLIPAFEKFVAARYPDGMALQMSTFRGEMSNLIDHWQLIERTLGKGVFEQVKGELTSLIDWLNSHQGQVLAFAQMLGGGLASAAHAAGDAFQFLVAVVPSVLAVISEGWGRLTTAVGTGASMAAGALAGFGTFLAGTILPLVEKQLGTMILWWQQHGALIRSELSTLAGNVQQAMAFLGSIIGNVLGAVQGYWTVAWGLLSGVATGALDLVTGHFTQFGPDMEKAFQLVANGSIDIMSNMLQAMVKLLGQLLPHFNDLMHNLYTATKPFQDALVSIVDGVRLMIAGAFDSVGHKIDELMNKVHEVTTSSVAKFLHLPQMGYDAAHDMFSTSGVTAAQRAAQVHEQDVTAMQIGLRPDENVVFGQTTDQAIAAIKKRAAQIKQEFATGTNGLMGTENNVLLPAGVAGEMGVLNSVFGGPTGGVGATGADAQKTGADALKTLSDALSRMTAGGLHMAGGGPGGGLGPPPGPGDLTVPGFDMTDPKAAHKAAAEAVSQAKDQFQLDILQNAPQTKLLADIAVILSDMKKAGDSSVAIALERARDLKSIEGHTKQAAVTGGPFAPTRAYQAAGEGQTIAGFGFQQRDALAESNAHLRSLVANEAQQIAMLTDQNGILREQLRAQTAAAVNTGILARGAQLPAPQARDPRAAHALVPARRA